MSSRGTFSGFTFTPNPKITGTAYRTIRQITHPPPPLGRYLTAGFLHGGEDVLSWRDIPYISYFPFTPNPSLLVWYAYNTPDNNPPPPLLGWHFRAGCLHLGDVLSWHMIRYNSYFPCTPNPSLPVWYTV